LLLLSFAVVVVVVAAAGALLFLVSTYCYLLRCCSSTGKMHCECAVIFGCGCFNEVTIAVQQWSAIDCEFTG